MKLLVVTDLMAKLSHVREKKILPETCTPRIFKREAPKSRASDNEGEQGLLVRRRGRAVMGIYIDPLQHNFVLRTSNLFLNYSISRHHRIQRQPK